METVKINTGKRFLDKVLQILFAPIALLAAAAVAAAGIFFAPVALTMWKDGDTDAEGCDEDVNGCVDPDDTAWDYRREIDSICVNDGSYIM